MKNIFPINPQDQATVTIHGSLYTYYDIDKTWYITGSGPGYVDPVKFFRATVIANGNKFIEFITTYKDFTTLQKWQSIENTVNTKIEQVEKIIIEYDNLPSEVKTGSLDHIAKLQDLIVKYRQVLDQKDPDHIVWPEELL